MDDAERDTFDTMVADIHAGSERLPGRDRWEPLWDMIVANIRKVSDPRDDPFNKLSDAHDFLESLDSALHSEWGPFAKEHTRRGQMWRHRDIDGLYSSTKASARDHFVEREELKKAARTYIESPWLHNPYLDWVFLDAITAGDLVSAIEGYRQRKQGMAYAFCNGVWWKILIWRLTLTPLVFLIGWVLPIALVVYFYNEHPWVIWPAIAYYALSFIMLGVKVWARISALLRGQPTIARRVTKIITAAGRAYDSLRGPALHLPSITKAFDKAVESGVNFDQVTFYILDHVAKKNPAMWETALKGSYA
jgi:hypothetical protein